MSCPVCNDHRGDGVCTACIQAGHDQLACGCVEHPDGTLQPCSLAHALCEGCGTASRQTGDTVCGDCRAFALLSFGWPAGGWLRRVQK